MEQIYEKFLQMECEKNLFETLQVNQIKIWHYIRCDVYETVLHAFGRPENPNARDKFYKNNNSVKDWVDENILHSQFRVKPKDVLIINHQRRMKYGDYYKCVYTDEWLKKFDKSYYVYENPYEEKFYFKPVKTKNLRYINIKGYNEILHKKYRYLIDPKECKQLSFYIINILENEFGIVLKVKDKRKIVDIIPYTLSEREIWRDYYNFLVKRIKPKIIIYVIGYGFDRMILAEIAKEYGIPTIELQHGQIGRQHLAYNFKDNAQLKAFPQYLFVTGQFDKDVMRCPIPRDNIYVVGSPEMDTKTNSFVKKESQKVRKKIITLISSGEKEIVEAAIELSQKLNKNNFILYFKLHPSEYTNWKIEYPNLVDSGVQVIDDSRHDIYYYLAVSDFLIGTNSTVLYEATRFQCDIMVLRKGYYFVSKDLVETGNAIYIDSVDQLLDRINSNVNKRKESYYFYCNNSCKLIYNAIDDILEKTYKNKK